MLRQLCSLPYRPQLKAFSPRLLPWLEPVIGFLVAAWEYPWLADGVLSSVNPRWVADIVSFFVIFVAIALLAGIAGRITSWAVREAGLKWMDRFLGAVFGFVRGLLVVTVVCLATAAFAPGARLAEPVFRGPLFFGCGQSCYLAHAG